MAPLTRPARPLKIVIVSTILPHGHYTENLCNALAQTPAELILYTPTTELSDKLSGRILQKNIWRKGFFFAADIIKQVSRDKPDIIHLQHEFTMYGGVITALLFPILVFLLKLLGYRVVTTFHAVVSATQIDEEFIRSFMIKKPFYISPFTFTLVFSYIYTIVSTYSHRLICHTNILRQTLVDDYGVPADKVTTIPPVVPRHTLLRVGNEPYFFYYGYMVRRKGIEYLLEGFKKVVAVYPQYRLVMAGGVIPGQEQAFEELKKKIAALGIDRYVDIKGFIEQETELDELYAKAYAVVIPARLSIAASGPLYHARGYHKCLIASNIGNFMEEVQQRNNGILVSNDLWHEALLEVIENPDLVKKMEAGSATKAEDHSPRNIAKRYYDVYRNMI